MEYGSSQPNRDRQWDINTSPFSRIENSQHGLVWTWQKRSRKAKVEKFTGKLMAVLFWDSKGALLTRYTWKVWAWMQYTTARSFTSWKWTSVTSGLIWGMSRFTSRTIMPDHILPSSWQHFSTSLVGLFFHIRLIRLIWYPVIFVYSCASKISWVAILILMVIMLKNRLSHVVFLASFLWQSVLSALRYAVEIFTFGMIFVY